MATKGKKRRVKTVTDKVHKAAKDALREYTKLPDPPLPGTEDEQYAKLVSTNETVSKWFSKLLDTIDPKSGSTRVETLAIARFNLLRPYTPASQRADNLPATITHDARVLYDVARSIVDRAISIALQQHNLEN